MKLKVSPVKTANNTIIFELIDSNLNQKFESHFYILLANEMNVNILDLKTQLMEKFNGYYFYNELKKIYFPTIEEANRALEWIEAIIVASKLAGQKSKNYILDSMPNSLQSI